MVVGALGSISKKLEKYVEELGVVTAENRTALLQKTALLGAARILRKVLDCGKDLWKQGWGEFAKEKKRWKMARGGGIVPKTELVRKNVKV